MLIDTHSHIYSDDFDHDRNLVIERAINAGVKKIILPNIDSSSIERMLELTDNYPGYCYPMMGLHPTSVNENYKAVLQTIENWLEKRDFIGIGEIGVDLYWDKTFKQQQEDAFLHQVKLAKNKKLPIAIHLRNSFDEVFRIIEKEAGESLTGIFHCFSGNEEDAKKITALGFKLGIGGVITFKNSKLGHAIKNIGIEHIVLETDSPYLSPSPFRGKRNESSYLVYIAKKLAEIYSMPVEEVAKITSENALKLFRIKSGTNGN